MENQPTIKSMSSLKAFFSEKRAHKAFGTWILSLILFAIIFAILTQKSGNEQDQMDTLLVVDVAIGSLAFVFVLTYYLIRYSLFRKVFIFGTFLFVGMCIIAFQLFNMILQNNNTRKMDAINSLLETEKAKNTEPRESITPTTATTQFVPEQPVNYQTTPQPNQQEEVVNCNAKLYNARGTKEQCYAVIILDERAQDKIDAIEKEQKECGKKAEDKASDCYKENESKTLPDLTCGITSQTEVMKCLNEATKKSTDVYNDLAKAIKKIIK